MEDFYQKLGIKRIDKTDPNWEWGNHIEYMLIILKKHIVRHFMKQMQKVQNA